MGTVEILTAAVSLSLDAFAVSVCKGLTLGEKSREYLSAALKAGLYFGGFQGVMPLIGHALGSGISGFISDFGHIAAFVILAAIGFGMIKEAFGDESETDPSFGARAMLPLALATSIDALTAGLGFAFLRTGIAGFALFTATVTFAVSFAGVMFGRFFGSGLRKGAQTAGGIVLILLGIKILAENLAA